jgi:L-ascorbate metabolism protein UlaG (beta-lactamase superfamily)
MIVRYLGHSSFFVSSRNSTSVIIDPYGTYLGYQFPLIQSDVVVVSHEHKDHNADWRVTGNPIVIKRTCDFPVEHELPVKRTGETLTFKGIPTFHDDASGRKRGPNTVFIWEMNNIRVCHLGDLGHLLTPQQLKDIGRVDILFLPVGGKITLGSSSAALLVNQLSPRLIFPMHFKTRQIDGLGLAEEEIDSFTGRMSSVDVISSLAYEVTNERLKSNNRVILLDYQ